MPATAATEQVLTIAGNFDFRSRGIASFDTLATPKTLMLKTFCQFSSDSLSTVPVEPIAALLINTSITGVSF